MDIQDGFRLYSRGLLDKKKGPYTSLSAATSALGTNDRSVGQEVFVITSPTTDSAGNFIGGTLHKYVFDGGITDAHLVPDGVAFTLAGHNVTELDDITDAGSGAIITPAERGEIYEISNKVNKVSGKGLSTNDYTAADLAAVHDIPNKVDKITGMGLSHNDFSDALDTKLDGIEDGAKDDQIADEVPMTGYVKPAAAGAIAASDSVDTAIGKLEKGLDSATAGGGDANVQSDWDQTNTSSDDFIKNKPSSVNAVTSVNSVAGPGAVVIDGEDIEVGTNIAVNVQQGRYDIGDTVDATDDVYQIIKNMLNNLVLPTVLTPVHLTSVIPFTSLIEVGTLLSGTMTSSKSNGEIDSKDSHSNVAIKASSSAFAYSATTGSPGINATTGAVSGNVQYGVNSWISTVNFTEGTSLYYDSDGGVASNLDSIRSAETKTSTKFITGAFPLLLGLSEYDYPTYTSTLIYNDAGIDHLLTTTSAKQIYLNGTSKIIYFLIPMTADFNNGVLSSIKDGNGFEMLATANPSFDISTFSVVSDGLAADFTQNYKMYKYNRGFTSVDATYVIHF